jgi:hypothetical protein
MVCTQPDEPVAIQLLNPVDDQAEAEQRRFHWQKFGFFRIFDGQGLSRFCFSRSAMAHVNERPHRPKISKEGK